MFRVHVDSCTREFVYTCILMTAYDHDPYTGDGKNALSLKKKKFRNITDSNNNVFLKTCDHCVHYYFYLVFKALLAANPLSSGRNGFLRPFVAHSRYGRIYYV